MFNSDNQKESRLVMQNCVTHTHTDGHSLLELQKRPEHDLKKILRTTIKCRQISTNQNKF